MFSKYNQAHRLHFRLERRTRLPGQDWTPWRLEAECRHYIDALALFKTRKGDVDRREVDPTGRQVQAEYRLVSNSTGDAISTCIVGV